MTEEKKTLGAQEFAQKFREDWINQPRRKFDAINKQWTRILGPNAEWELICTLDMMTKCSEAYAASLADSPSGTVAETLEQVRNTCVVCGASLLPEKTVPHCLDCHPNEHEELDYEVALEKALVASGPSVREKELREALGKLHYAVEKRADIGKRRELTVSPLMEEALAEAEKLLSGEPETKER